MKKRCELGCRALNFIVGAPGNATRHVKTWLRGQEELRGYLVKAVTGGLLVSTYVHHNWLHHLQVALHICMSKATTRSVFWGHVGRCRP